MSKSECSMKRKKFVPFDKTLFTGGGAQLGGHSKNLMFFGGSERNVSSKENSPSPQ